MLNYSVRLVMVGFIDGVDHRKEYRVSVEPMVGGKSAVRAEWGRIGGHQSSQIKAAGLDAESCEVLAERLVSEKVKKGYVLAS